MFNKINHQYSGWANKTSDWLPMDTKERYEENLKNKLYELQKFNWVDSTFTYQFNSHGFRCEEFTEDPSIMFLGCSHVMGVGVPLENIWPTLVSKELNLKMINLGIGGSGADTAFRLANHYIPQLQPKIVIYLQSYKERFSLLTRDKVHEFTPIFYPIEFEKFYFEWINCDENLVLHELKHNLAMEMLCNKNNIKLITFNVDCFSILDFARDLCHLGIKSNDEFSKLVLNAI